MPAQPQQPQGGDNALAPLWVTLAIIVAAAVIWFYAKEYIIAVVLKIRLFELYLISFFTNKLEPLAASIKATPFSNYENITFDSLVNISNEVGAYLAYPLLAILLILAAISYFLSPVANLKKVYTMSRLAEQEEHEWPQIVPVVKLDLVAQDIDTGPWAMSLQPMHFAKKYDLIQLETITEQHGEILVHPLVKVILKRNEAQRVFALQLGKYWNGVNNLSMPSKALFAIFAARIAGDRAGSSRLIYTIGGSARGKTLDFSGVEELITKHANNKYVQRITQRHAFEYTVLASLLLLSRDDGVLASSDFLWLKPVDRMLWYVLNTVGRKTPFVEIAGVFAHWMAELRFGRKLRVPFVETAVDGLDIALQEVQFKADNVEDEEG